MTKVKNWAPSAGAIVNGADCPVRPPASTVALTGTPNLTALIRLPNDPGMLPTPSVTARVPGELSDTLTRTLGRGVHEPVVGGGWGVSGGGASPVTWKLTEA